MFKLVVLSAILACAAAGYVSPVTYTVAENHGYAKVGEIVEKVPTAVSHQSSTVVHNKAAVVKSVVAPVVQKTIVQSSPVVYNGYAPEQLVYSAPVAYKTVAAPQTYVYSAPAIQKTIVDGSTSSVSKTYVAEPDSVRYTEQSQNTPTKYVYSSPVVQKTVYTAPAVKYVSAPAVKYVSAPAVKYVSGPAYYSAPAVHAW